MGEYLSLTKVLIKGFSLLDAKTNKNAQIKTIALTLVLVLSFLPTSAFIYYFTDKMYKQLDLFDQTGLILVIGFMISSMLVFVFASFIVPAVFYFSKDIEALLPLPLKPETIISAKFTTTLIYEYITSCVILLPILAAYVVNRKFDPIVILFSLICFLVVPVLPLVYSTVIAMFLMRFAPFVKNKDTFTYIAGILGIALGLGISTTSSKFATLETNEMINLLLEGDNSLMNIVNTIFPTNQLGVKALIDKDILMLILYVGGTALLYLAFLIIAKLIYFKGVIGIGESKKSKKGYDKDKTLANSSMKNSIFSYMKKEILLIMRTPIYFMNCILIILIMPLFAAFPTIINNSGEIDFNKIAQYIDLQNKEILTVYIGASLAIGLLYGAMNSIAASAISREGQNYYFMKYIPLSYKKQINAKVFIGILVALIGSVLIIIPLMIILKISIVYAVLSIILAFIGSIFTAYMGIIIDLIKPVLVWENEQKAVKQNLNVMINMFAGMSIAAVVLVASIFIPVEAYVKIFLLIGGCLILDLVIYMIVHRLAPKCMDRL